MKHLFLALLLSATAALAGPILNIDRLGEQLGGWEAKGNRAADYERSGSKYRTWKPEVTPMLDGGLFISMRIDHLRGLFASDDHASLQVTLDKNGNIVAAQSSMAFQGRKITSDAVRLGTSAGTKVIGVDQVTEVGTDLLADLSSKLLRENVAEPGRVTFPAVIHHNYNFLCLATGIITDAPQKTEEAPTPQPEKPVEEKPAEETPVEEKPTQEPLKVNSDKDTVKKTGRPNTLPTGP